MPAPVLDGTNTGVATSTTTVATPLTTTATNDIVCALIYLEHNTTSLWITGVTGGGLTWSKRTQATTFQGAGLPNTTYRAQTLELWWAVAPSALAAVTITATSNATFDDAALLVFGVSGCNTANPWDANASLAARLAHFSASTPSFANISTTQANDFLIFGFGSSVSQAIGTVPTGFTQINSRINGGGANFASIGAAYRGVTAAQSNQTYAWGSAFSSGTNAVIFDALTADTGGATTAPRPTWEVITRKTTSLAASTVALDTAGISANDVILVLSYVQNSGGTGGGTTPGPGVAISGISGGGLTWARRTRSNASAGGSLEIWSAQAAGTLAASTVTVTYASAPDSACVLLMSVVGCDASRWDANGSLPAKQSNTAGANPWTASVSSISMGQAHDMVIAMAGTNANPAATITSVPSGFMLLDQVVSTNGFQPASFGIGIQHRSTTQSGVTIAWGGTIPDRQSGIPASGEYLIDALTADAGGGAGATTQARALVLA